MGVMVLAVEQIYHRFTDDDISKLIQAQSTISENVAVAATNITWVIKTYNDQWVKLVNLQKEVGDLKAEIWKYIGIGIGASATISFIIAVLPYLLRMIGS
jgi:hypothetical protein